MSLTERYSIDRIRNRTVEMVCEAVERRIGERSDLCQCEECVLDLVAYTLNRATPRYATSLLGPLAPDPALERRIHLEIGLAIESGIRKLKEHPHHG